MKLSNTNVMTKEEKIKEAYGEYFHQVKEYLDDDGWCRKYTDINILENITCDFKEMHIVYKNPENWIRPESLQGIENNNGWIKIKSEEDLPKETIECITCFYDGKHYVQGNTGERNAEQLLNAYRSVQITHYQPIEKPKPPIY